MTAPALVLFDLDDTLFAHREAVADGISAHRRIFGGPLGAADDDTEATRWHTLEEKHYARYLRGELDWQGQRRARVRAFVEPFGLDLADDARADSWFDGYRLEYERAWSLHSDTLRCLETLRAEGIRIGIVTNGDFLAQSTKIERIALNPFVEHVIASGDLGFAKPDRRIFELACRTFGVGVSEAVFVGDRLETDAIGAALAGLTGVWLDRRGEATADELDRAAESGVAVIRCLDELLPLLRR